MKILNYWHNKAQDVIIKYLDDDGNKQYKKIQYDAYFWVLTKDLEKTDKALKGLEVNDHFSGKTSEITFTKGEEEGEWIKIYYSPINEIYLKSIIKKIIEKLNFFNIKHCECDLWPGDCWMLDNPDIEISDSYRILYYDIETKDTVGGVEIGRDRILSICGIDNNGKEYRFCDDDETITLQNFIDILEDYDILMGWNSKKFDDPYLKKRLIANNIYFSFKSIILIDLMKVFMESFSVSHFFGRRYIESFALDAIAKEFLQDKKLQIDESQGYGGRIFKMFTDDREKLLKYNMQDCILLKKLDEKFHLLQNEREVSKYVGFPLSKTRSASAIVDNLLLRECRKRKIHWKTAPNYGDTIKEHQEGGEVLTPLAGLHNNINIYDANSLYPNVFRVANISPDTLLTKEESDCIKLPAGYCYTKKFVGFVPEVLDKLTELRLQYKAEKVRLKSEGKKEEATLKDFQETALKVIILSTYGVMGAPFSRFFSIDVANSITTFGQHLLRNISKELDSNGFKVVFGDTDSVGFKLDDENKRNEAEAVIKNTIQKVVDSINTNRPNTLKMSREKTFKRFLILSKTEEIAAKKKYCGRMTYDDGKITDELYFRGIELAKSSEIKITKQFLEEILKYILWCDKEPEIKELEKIIMKYKKRILNKDVKADEITIVKKVGKMPEAYKNLPQHVALAQEKAKEGEYFYVNMKIPYIVMSNNPLKIIHKRDFTEQFDTDYYWRVQLYPPVFRTLKTIFPKYNWEKYDTGDMQHQSSIFDFT